MATTMAPPASGLTSPTFGYIAIAVSALGFGTCYLPVKKFNMGDGMFFQWIMCTAIAFTGVIVNIAVGAPQFHPFAMIGGAMWATGNSFSIIIIEAIGVGLGVLTWSMFNMVFGWASSRFGWFGIPSKVPTNAAMNYAGVALALCSVIIYGFITPNTPKESDEFEDGAAESDANSELSDRKTKDEVIKFELDEEVTVKKKCCFPSIPKIQDVPMIYRRIIGFSLSAVAGLFYGLNFVPTIYIQGNTPGASQEGLDYVFSNFIGTWFASTIWFVLYAVFNKNKPKIPSVTMVLPALLCGILWSLGQSAWFVANAALGEPITFPIITTLPGLLSMILGMIFFKEIKGLKNYLLLGLAICITAVGVTLTSLSR